MEEQHTARILEQLASREPQQAWAEFLELYSALILQVVRHFEAGADHISDCFLFVCEHLSQKRFRRLRRFRAAGPASFPTWLRAVVRNLCLDWHRREFGRYRVSQSIRRLSALDQEAFRLLYRQKVGTEESFLRLRLAFPQASVAEIAGSVERIWQSLAPRQRWLLSIRRHNPEATGAARERETEQPLQIPDMGPDPESIAARQETRTALWHAVAGLPRKERLLIRLRYEQDLTLEEVAKVLGLGDAQTADRRIREVLKRLRKELS